MIEMRTAKKLMINLIGMPMTPTDEGQVKLRTEALAFRARSTGHAERVVTGLLETMTYFPTVAEIVQACEYTPDDAAVVSSRKDCRWCQGDGWRSVDGPFGTSAAYVCNHTGQSNERMGVRIPPVVQRHYAEESITARRRMNLAPSLDVRFKRPAEELLSKLAVSE